MPFSFVSDLEFDLLISSNLSNNKFLPIFYSMNEDYFSPQHISKLVCNNQNKSLLITYFNNRSLAKNKKFINKFIILKLTIFLKRLQFQKQNLMIIHVSIKIFHFVIFSPRFALQCRWSWNIC